MRWRHSRKGLIVGTIIAEFDEMVDIRVENDVNMTPASRYANDWAQPGDVIRVRRSLLTELPSDA